MALAAIYEKGLVNNEMERGGSQSFGALQKNCAEPETDKAFEYYNDAAENESYALYKLGQFVENGVYDGKPNKTFAFSFYYKACQRERTYREALQKFGEYYQYGIYVDKNVKTAQRKMEESAADGSLLGMNALGSMFYNEHNNFHQAAEWFKKASDKGLT